MRIRKIYIVFAIAAFCLCVLLYQCNKVYYSEYNLVKAELEKIKGIEIRSIDGNPDLTLEDIYATIKLKNGDILTFENLGKNTFTQTNSIHLVRLNSWEFNGTGCVDGGNWGGGFLDVGKNSPYLELQNLDLKNVQDVVNHIHVLRRFVVTISVHPSFDTLKTGNTFVYFQKYSVVQVKDTRELKDADCPE